VVGQAEPESADAYADPSVYDVLHTPGSAAEVDGLERIVERFVSRRPYAVRWLEPCSGTGRFMRVAAGRGGRVLGVELDPRVAAYANARFADRGWKRRACTIVGDIRTLDRIEYPAGFGGPFGFAFCPHNSLRHLGSARDLTAHLRAVAAVLAPGGVYAVGIGLQEPGGEIFGEDVYEAQRGRTRVCAVFEYFEAPGGGGGGGGAAGSPRLERVVSHTTVHLGGGRGRKGRRSRTILSSYDLLCVDPAMWAGCVRRAGLVEIAVVDDERAADVATGRSDYAYRVLAHPDHPRARLFKGGAGRSRA
jgi:hypothetical protein